MNVYRIFAMVQRYMYHWMSDWMYLVRIFYWPLLEIAIMGYTAWWISTPELMQVTLAAAICWQVVIRTNYEIMDNLLLECWSANIPNLFASPLTLSEWIVSAAILGILLQSIIIPCSAVFVYYVFGYSFVSLGFFGPCILMLLFLSGFALALLSSGFIISKGESASSFVYMIGWGFAVTSGIYFSLDVLPGWMQLIAKSMPLIYTFNVLRTYALTQQMLYDQFIIALLLNIVYLALATLFFYWQFDRSRKRGLSQLTKL